MFGFGKRWAEDQQGRRGVAQQEVERGAWVAGPWRSSAHVCFESPSCAGINFSDDRITCWELFDH